MKRWFSEKLELICGCQFLFHSVVFRVWGVFPHLSLDPTASSTCLGPAQLGSPSALHGLLSTPLGSRHAEDCRKCLAARLHTDRSLISSSLALHCSLNLVLLSGVMCRDPPGTSSILVQHTPSTSFKAVKSWADFGPGFVTVSQVPAGIYPIISTVLWLQKKSYKNSGRRSSSALQQLACKVSSDSVLTAPRWNTVEQTYSPRPKQT